MTTDDSDIESSNPSKSFKVGDFDRLSGFFTPVWESKRRIRSESPIPALSPAAPASSKSGTSSQPASSTPPVSSPAESAPIEAYAAVPVKVATVPPAAGRVTLIPEPTPVPPQQWPIKQTTARLGSGAQAAQASVPSASPTPLEAARAEPQSLAATPTRAEQQAASIATTPAAVAVRPMIPMPAAPPRAGARSKPPSQPPSAAARALEQAGPNLPAEAFLDREPEFRTPLPPRANPPRAERPALHYRSLRASAAATAVHEQIKAKRQTDAVESPPRYRETDSDREAARAVAANAVPAAPEPYPLQLLRRLRRTIHLSTPLPESVRSLLAKYDRN